MIIKMTGIQRLRYFSMIGKDNPFKDVMLAEVISGNMTFSDPDSVSNPDTIVDEILGIVGE